MNENSSGARETLRSRLGFILLAAGCAIGMGNVWRFPYIVGQYGGAIFVLFYIFFLVVLGFPVMVAELAVGRGGQASLGRSMARLQSPASRRIPWGTFGKIAFAGNYILLMFYTVVTGWLLRYTWAYIAGTFSTLPADEIGPHFGNFICSTGEVTGFTYLAIVFAVAICAYGLQAGVERITKYLMLGLFLLMFAMIVQAMTLDGSGQGFKFFLQPNTATLAQNGLWQAIHAAMTQAFFTLSLGIGSISIFGSYIAKSKSLAGEAVIIIALDTLAAICAGLVIFPSCAAFNVTPNAGPPLIFITLPHVFQNMAFGRFHGTLFFLFMSIAAMTTLVAVTENIIAFTMDEFRLNRRKASLAALVILFIISLPCIFGFSIWSGFHPFGGDSNILDLEDFVVSDNLLPLGSLMIILFCTRKWGWGSDKFLAETNTGTGLKLPQACIFYIKWILPLIILAIWAIGIIKKFA